MLDDAQDIEFQGKCHDCGNPTSVIAGIVFDKPYTEGGAVYKVDVKKNDGIFIKCEECFKKDKTLRNWRPTEVYSRVVGYLRPLNNWNKGKVEEFKLRTLFNVNKVIGVKDE